MIFALKENRLLARLISNVCRRTVSSAEKKEILEKLGEICLEEGEKPGKLAHRIAEETGISYTWVMKYLPDKYKQRLGLGGPSNVWNVDKYQENSYKSQVTRRVTIDLAKLLSFSQEKPVIVKGYANTDFVNLTLEKRIYKRYERLAEKCGVVPEKMISNAMIIMLEEIEKMASSIDSGSAKSVFL